MTDLEQPPLPLQRLTGLTSAPTGWAAYYGQNVAGRADAVTLPVIAWAVNRIPLPDDADDEQFEGGPEQRAEAVVILGDGRLLTAAEAAAAGRMELLTIAYGFDAQLPPQVHQWAAQQTVDRLRGAQPA